MNTEEKIQEQLHECVELLLECDKKNKHCIVCCHKDTCLKFIRSVLAAICRIQLLQMEPIPINEDMGLMFA